MIKKIIYLSAVLLSILALSGCGSVNYAPGKAYMDAEPSVSVS